MTIINGFFHSSRRLWTNSGVVSFHYYCVSSSSSSSSSLYLPAVWSDLLLVGNTKKRQLGLLIVIQSSRMIRQTEREVKITVQIKLTDHHFDRMTSVLFPLPPLFCIRIVFVSCNSGKKPRHPPLFSSCSPLIHHHRHLISSFSFQRFQIK